MLAWVGVGLATGRFGVENAKYTVVRRLGPGGSLELRRYEPHTEAVTIIHESELQPASSRGFRFLAGYIFGGNQRSESIAMTTPVCLTRPLPGAQQQQHKVSFVMPSKHSYSSLPQPNDPRVELVQHDAPELHIARRMSMFSLERRFDEARINREFARLEEEAMALGITWDPANVSRTVKAYDPPWTPFFVARTEVSMHPVQER